MSREEALRKLLQLGPLEPLFAREVCGWPVDEFESTLSRLLAEGLVRRVCGCNQHATRLEAA